MGDLTCGMAGCPCARIHHGDLATREGTTHVVLLDEWMAYEPGDEELTSLPCEEDTYVDARALRKAPSGAVASCLICVAHGRPR